MINKEILDEIKKLKSIADVGSLYSTNEYDKERYAELQNMAFRLLNTVSGHSIESLHETFPLTKNYPTAKVDIRGMVLSPDKTKVLLAQESIDGRWSIPGGWADIGYTPKEIIIKEFKEETGLTVVPEKLIAVFDTRMHAHPPEPFYVYKIVFYCRALSSHISKGFDILDVQYFDMNDLPPLSENRILKSQLELLYNKIISSANDTHFD